MVNGSMYEMVSPSKREVHCLEGINDAEVLLFDMAV